MAENYENDGSLLRDDSGALEPPSATSGSKKPESHSSRQTRSSRKRKSHDAADAADAAGGKSDANDAAAAGAEPKGRKVSSDPTRKSSRIAAVRTTGANDAKASAFEGRLRRRCPTVDNASDGKENQAPGSKVAAEPDDEVLLEGLVERAEQLGISRDELTERIQKAELDIDALAELVSEGTEKAVGVEELWEGGDAAKPKRAPEKKKTKKKRTKRPGLPPVSNKRLARIMKNLLEHSNTERGKLSPRQKKVILPAPSKKSIIDPKDLPEKLRKKVAWIAAKIGYEAALLALGVTPSEFGKMGYKGRVDKTMKEHGVDEAGARTIIGRMAGQEGMAGRVDKTMKEHGVDKAGAKTLIGQEIYAGARAKAKEDPSSSNLRCPETAFVNSGSIDWIELKCTTCGHVIQVGDKTGDAQPDWYTGDNWALECCRYCIECKARHVFRPPAVIEQREAASGTYQCKECEAMTVVQDHISKFNIRPYQVNCKTCKVAGKGPVKSRPGQYRFIEKHWKAC